MNTSAAFSQLSTAEILDILNQTHKCVLLTSNQSDLETECKCNVVTTEKSSLGFVLFIIFLIILVSLRILKLSKRLLRTVSSKLRKSRTY